MTSEQKQVLIVDDDESFRSRLTQAFLDRGFNAHSAKSFSEAMNVVEHFRPEWAVIDLKMADVSGLDVLKYLVDRFPKITAVVLTGYGSIATALEAVKLGAKHYLSKPASTTEIIAALQSDSSITASTHKDDVIPSLSQIEWEYIQRVIANCDGNISQASKKLGIHRRSLQRKLAKSPGKLV